MTKYPYVLAREQRLVKEELQRLRIMGGTLAIVFWLISAFQYYLVPTERPGLDTFWHFGLWFAVVLFTLIMFRPRFVQPLERLLKIVGQFLGGLLLKMVLTILYFFVVTPLGLVLQKVQKNNLFMSWEEAPQLSTSWEDKKNTADKKADKPVPFLFFPFYVVYIMAQNKAYFIIPLIINLLLIAMLVFFVQTPVVAPFVYTVF